MKRSEAYRLRGIVEQAAGFLDDKTASTAPTLFGKLKQDGALVQAGTRINWKGTLKRAAVDLWDTAENTPEAAPALWSDLTYREGYRIIPEVLTVSTAFSKDEIGWWGDVLYRSLTDANVYTPEAYPGGWEAV